MMASCRPTQATVPGAFMEVKSVVSNVGEQLYKEAMESSSTYNIRLTLDRKMRMPFLDSQTGVAQYHTSLFMPYRCRSLGARHGQLYTYPAKRWRKKKSFFPFEPCVQKAEDLETGEADMHHIRAVENPVLARVVEDSIETSRDSETSRDKWYGYDEISNISDPPDMEEIEDRHSDSSDYDPTASKKKKKKNTKKGGGRGRKSQSMDRSEVEDKEKPYVCDLCGARYKTRPGLTYHLNHTHASRQEREEQDDEATLSPSIRSLSSATPASSETTFTGRRGRGESDKRDVSHYCDFCLGDELENKKTGQKEELVSCGDCGRSGHPTCLQFTPNMIISVKKYPWQCIECKSCGLCGTSDNDDQLLFCDDCDRGYHMYCLTPPLSEPPEGSWSCHLCIVEFYGGVKPDGMQ